MLKRDQNYQLTAIQIYLNLGQLEKAQQLLMGVERQATSPMFMLYLKASIAAAQNNLPRVTNLLKLRLDDARHNDKYVYPYIAALYESGKYQQLLTQFHNYYPHLDKKDIQLNNKNKYILALVYQSKLKLQQSVPEFQLSQLDSIFPNTGNDVDGLYWHFSRGKKTQTRSAAVKLLQQGWLPDYNQDMFALHKLEKILGSKILLQQMLHQNRAQLN